jgi:hypothetical protein
MEFQSTNRRSTITKSGRWLTTIGAIYSFIAVVYFFVGFAHNMGSDIADYLPWTMLSLVVACSGYLILLTASWLAIDSRVDTGILIASSLLLLVTLPLYSGAFYPAQDGEFGVVFVLLGLPTICIGVVLALCAVLMRRNANRILDESL